VEWFCLALFLHSFLQKVVGKKAVCKKHSAQKKFWIRAFCKKKFQWKNLWAIALNHRFKKTDLNNRSKRKI
jgi:hypothetical protein